MYMYSERNSISLGTPRLSSQHNDFFKPEGQRVENKRQRQETETSEKEKGTRESLKACLPYGDGGQSAALNIEETDVTHSKMAVYKYKRGNNVLG